MMNIWHDLSPERVKETDFDAVIEITKGGKAKYELDKETGFLKLDRVLYTSTHSVSYTHLDVYKRQKVLY